MQADPIAAQPRTATHRRELRRKVRNMLGDSRDAAPGPLQALNAARDMDGLVTLATAGRYALTLYDVSSGEQVAYGDAIRAAVDAGTGW